MEASTKGGTKPSADEWSLSSTLASRWKELLASPAGSGVGERVRVTHQDGGILGVQLMRFDVNKLRELERRLEAEAEKMLQPERLAEQDVVAAYVNSSVVRGVISTAVVENEARVYLLDYGITETLRIDKVRHLPTEFVTALPLYGIRVLIDKDPSIDGFTPEMGGANSLVDRIIHLVSIVPCSLTTARAHIHVIEADHPEATAKCPTSESFLEEFTTPNVPDSTAASGDDLIEFGASTCDSGSNAGGSSSSSSSFNENESVNVSGEALPAHNNDNNFIENSPDVDEDQRAVVDAVEHIKDEVERCEVLASPVIDEEGTKVPEMASTSAANQSSNTRDHERRQSTAEAQQQNTEQQQQKQRRRQKHDNGGSLTDDGVTNRAKEKKRLRVVSIAPEVLAQVRATISNDAAKHEKSRGRTQLDGRNRQTAAKHDISTPPRLASNMKFTGNPSRYEGCRGQCAQRCENATGDSVNASSVTARGRKAASTNDQGVSAGVRRTANLSNATSRRSRVQGHETDVARTSGMREANSSNYTGRSSIMSKRDIESGRTMNRSNNRRPSMPRPGAKLVLMEVPVKFLRQSGPTRAVVLSLNLLNDVERAVKSLTVPPSNLNSRKIFWGSRVLIRRPQGLCRATVDWRESKGVWWHCIFDDYDDPPIHVRAGEILECPPCMLCLPRALMYVHCFDKRNVFPRVGEMSTLNVFEYMEIRGPITDLPMNRVVGYFTNDARSGPDAPNPKSESSTSTDSPRVQSSAAATSARAKSPNRQCVRQ